MGDLVSSAVSSLSCLREQFPWIDRITVESIDDESEKALLVHVAVRSGVENVFGDGRQLLHLRRLVRRVLADAQIDAWSYVRVISADELEAA